VSIYILPPGKGNATSSGRLYQALESAEVRWWTVVNTAAMINAMRGDCTNIAVLRQRYSRFCERLSQGTDRRFKEWIACARAGRSFLGPFCGVSNYVTYEKEGKRWRADQWHQRQVRSPSLQA
jgi:hypothetical protein